jgi:hypothetical protein
MKRLFFLVPLSFCLAACVELKEATVFDAPQKTPPPESVNGFYGVSIYEDDITSEFWGEENPLCFNAEKTKEDFSIGTYSLKVKWDKDIGVCDWIGMGFGWNGWMAKDMQAVYDSVAVSMKVRPLKGEFGNLPVAMAFEDYAGKQAWLGYTPKGIVPEKSGNGWTHIEFPISEFNWREQGANPGNIKQFVIQLEANGEFFFDDIKIVQRIGGFNNRYNALYDPKLEVKVDGKLVETIWSESETTEIAGSKLRVAASDKAIYVAGMISDNSPLMNDKSGNEIWNGDAFEFCLRADPYRPLGRSRMSSVDRHLAVAMTGKAKAWMFSDEKELKDYTLATQKVEGGYNFELVLPLSSLRMSKVNLRKIHAFEMALDFGDGQSRQSQENWNSPNGAQFHMAPATWGELVFVKRSSLATK